MDPLSWIIFIDLLWIFFSLHFSKSTFVFVERTSLLCIFYPSAFNFSAICSKESDWHLQIGILQNVTVYCKHNIWQKLRGANFLVYFMSLLLTDRRTLQRPIWQIWGPTWHALHLLRLFKVVLTCKELASFRRSNKKNLNIKYFGPQNVFKLGCDKRGCDGKVAISCFQGV